MWLKSGNTHLNTKAGYKTSQVQSKIEEITNFLVTNSTCIVLNLDILDNMSYFITKYFNV